MVLLDVRGLLVCDAFRLLLIIYYSSFRRLCCRSFKCVCVGWCLFVVVLFCVVVVVVVVRCCLHSLFDLL